MKHLNHVITVEGVRLDQSQSGQALFKVTYGKHVREDLSYLEAISEFGQCVFHSLACEGKLNNEGKL